MSEYELAYSSTTISPQEISINCAPLEDVVKKPVEKLEQHIDHLEEDIEFLNQHRIQQEEEIDRLQTKLNAAETNIAWLKTRENFLTNYTNYLEGRIAALEDKNKHEFDY